MSNAQRFQASSYRETIRQVRESLGDDALIISSRQTPEGVEIVAGPGAEQEAPSRPSPRPAAGGPRGDARQRLLQLGLSPWLAAELAEACPATGSLNERLRRLLLQRLSVPEDGPDRRLEEAGLVAVVGPTGIGKTTTIAKLATRHVARHGADSLALVCADGFRPGARDHLRHYARELGVDLFTLDAGQALAELEPQFSDRQLVLVDTAGLGPRDPRLTDSLALLSGTRRPLLPLLVLNAAAQGDALDAALMRYTEVMATVGLPAEAAILSKLDEAPHPGPALGMLIEHGLSLFYTAAGQQVPEDLRPGDPAQLVDEALQAVQWSPLQAVAEEADVLTRAIALERLYSELFRAFPGADDLGDALLEARPLDSWQPAVSHLAWYREGGLPALGRDDAGLPELAPAAPADGSPLDFPGSWQVLAVMPDSAHWLALLENGISWMVPAHPSTRVWHEGIRGSLLQLRSLAGPEPAGTLIRQGSALQLSLASLPVGLPLVGRRRRCSGLARAWFAELRQPDSGRRVSRRVWLAPAGLEARAIAELAATQLLAEDLARLRQMTLEQLPAVLGPDCRPGRHWFGLAHGLAALALRLSRDTANVDPELRAGLLALAGRRRRSDSALLDGLLQLCRQYRSLQARLPVRRSP